MGSHTWYYLPVEDTELVMKEIRVKTLLEIKELLEDPSEDIEPVFIRDTPLEIIEDDYRKIYRKQLELSLSILESNYSFWDIVRIYDIFHIIGSDYIFHPDEDIILKEVAFNTPVRFYHYPTIDTLTNWKDVLLLLEEYRLMEESNPYEGNLDELKEWFDTHSYGVVYIA